MSKNEWTGAELRTRAYRLGLSLPSLAILTGLDQRYLERVSAGKIGSVSERIRTAVEELEARADADFEAMRAKCEAGEPISIPRLNMRQEPGRVPAHWWLSLAARLISSDCEGLHIVWEE